MIYIDGVWYPESEARIPVTDRGFLLGDGAFATIQVRDGEPLFLDIHLKRLAKQAADLHIIPPEIRKEDVYETIARNGASVGIWRMKIVITGGNDPALYLPERAHGHVVILMHPFTPPPYAPLRLERFPIPPSTAHAHFKSLAHLNRLYIMEYARARGFDDCVTTTAEGLVLEAAYGNLFWTEGDSVWTPDPTLPLNFGVTISTLVGVMKERGWKVHYVRTSLEEIPESAALFRTNTMSGIRPIASIQGRHFRRDEAQFSPHPQIWHSLGL